MRRWVVILYNKDAIYAVIGPFGDMNEAVVYVPLDPYERTLQRLVQELVAPNGIH